MDQAIEIIAAFGGVLFVGSTILLFRARRKLGKTVERLGAAIENVDAAIDRLEEIGVE